MYRYLLNISYIGTNFRGIQKTINKLDEKLVDTTTIQGSIELALRVLRPVNEIKTVLSSRTDAGVHAQHSTLHVDLKRHDSQPYDCDTLTGILNRTLDKHRLPIRLLKTQIVPETFHCRYNAKARTYLYRIAVSKNITLESECMGNRIYETFIPIEEYDRCLFLHLPQFDIKQMRKVSRLFLGRHDFRTFMSTSRQKNSPQDHPMFTVRSIESITIESGKTLAIGRNAEKTKELYNYWDIEITSKSFVYKQVRRIFGTLLAASSGRIDEKSVYEMLTIPSKYCWNPRISILPAHGLYLLKVHYDQKDLEFPSEI